MAIKKHFKNFCSIKNNYEQFKKFDKDEETSAKDKYKDFTLDNLKKYQDMKKREEKFFNQKYNEYNSKGPLEVRKIAKELINRNFLKPKNSENKEETIPFSEIDIDTLKSLDKPILIYELSEREINGLNRTHKIFYKYFILATLFNACVFISPELIFTYNNSCYAFLYTVNILTYVSFLNNYKLRKNTVIQLEYLHNEESVMVKLMNTFGRGFTEKTHKLNELEIYTCNKFLENGIGLRVRDSNQVYIFDHENIWYHKDLFDNLFNIKNLD